MRALRIHARSGPEGLVVEDAPQPEPGIGDVLIRVEAASFTPTELAWPSNWVDHAGRDRTPVIPGHEVCGSVVALGYGTTGFGVGDRVYGLTDWYRDGAAAEYVAVEARNLARKPGSLDASEAAATAMPALTAQQALFDHGRLAAGHTVLIHGAAGGVGAFAIQLARAAGARVLACARSWARDLVLELGADEFIDADGRPFEEAVGEVDLVFDLVGGEVLERSWSVLRAGGAIVSVVDEPVADDQAGGGRRGVLFIVEASGAQLGELAAPIEAGELRPVVGEVRPLTEGRRAFAAKRGGGVRGKSVLLVAG